MEKIIGREKEMAEVRKCYGSNRSEFVIVYGRRRIGKTFLVNSMFVGKYDFYFTGMHKVEAERQLRKFAVTLQEYGKWPFPPELNDWFDAFRALQTLLSAKPRKRRKLVFIDEMPWIDTEGSDFVAALEDFWNGWAAQRDDICLIACGSATAWMTDHLVENQGGLHNRITSKIYLRPFCLAECEQYLRSHSCLWDRYQILQCYMYMGGVPFYLSLLDYQKSIAQNVDQLFFQAGGMLSKEFDELYGALFQGADSYIQLVRLLAERQDGMTRQELLDRTGIQGRRLTTMLANLESSDFIIGYSRFGSKKKGIIYRLKDFYTLFYLRFIEGVRTQSEPYWVFKVNRAEVLSWQGFSFELICLTHLNQIKQRLGLTAIQTYASSWRSSKTADSTGTQIDLLIDRADRMINLCEAKFSIQPYTITREYADKLRMRIAIFNQETKNRRPLLPTMITTYGVLPSVNSGIVQAEVTMDHLFAPTV